MRSRLQVGLPALVVVGVVVVAAAPALAQPSLTARVGALTVTGATPPQQAADATPYGSFAAPASYGTVSASATISIGENGSEDGLVTSAEFVDTLTVSAAGATTTNGFVTARFVVIGGPEYAQTASSAAVAQGVNTGFNVLRLQGAGSFNVDSGRIIYGSAQAPPEATIGSIPPPATLEIDFPFFFDFASDVGLRLDVDAAGSNLFSAPEDGTVSASTQMTLAWDEIVSIRDANDNELIGSATISSGSGTDYTVSQAPAQVPTASWLLLPIVLMAGVTLRELRTPAG